MKAVATNRTKKRPNYKPFRLQKRIKASTFKPLPSSWSLLKDSATLLLQNKKTVAMFIAIMGSLLIVFVRGLSGGINLTDIKFDIQEATGVEANNLTTSTLLFTNLLASSSATASDVAGIYQAIILIVATLSFIWLVRHIAAEKKVVFRMRDAFYKGLSPIVPFLAVSFVILLEFVPMSIGSFLLTTASSSGIVGGELFAVVLIAILLAILSLYLVSGSLMALFIVTLPGTDPMKALRSSSALTLLHRWSIVRKVIVFSMIVFGLLALVFIPLLLIIPDGYEYIAEAIYFIGSLVMFCLGITYLYQMYRSML